MPIEGREVLGRAIALVLGEAVFGILLVELTHHAIPLDLRDDRGRRNALAAIVPAHNALVGHAHAIQRATVNEDVLGPCGQTRNRPTHGLVGRPTDIEAIDLLMTRRPDRMRPRPIDELLVEGLASLGGEAFGVTNACDAAGGGKNNSCRNDWPGKGAPSDFVYTGDEVIAGFSGGAFEGVCRSGLVR